MSEELMPCPVCGGPVVLDGPSNPDASRDVVWPNCIDDSCPYMLDGGIPAAVAEAHNTLARRAEIGALVERMMSDARSVALRFGSAVDLTDGSEYVDAILWYRAAEESGRTQSYGQGGDLLDALRALAKEVGCE